MKFRLGGAKGEGEIYHNDDIILTFVIYKKYVFIFSPTYIRSVNEWRERLLHTGIVNGMG